MDKLTFEIQVSNNWKEIHQSNFITFANHQLPKCVSPRLPPKQNECRVIRFLYIKPVKIHWNAIGVKYLDKSAEEESVGGDQHGEVPFKVKAVKLVIFFCEVTSLCIVNASPCIVCIFVLP